MPQNPNHYPTHARAAVENPAGRFEPFTRPVEPETREALRDPEEDEQEPKRIPAQLFKDTSRTILSTNDSPDIGMDRTLNPYRGCEHGCIYCYARPTHEYLGLSPGLDFETKIFIKPDAAKLLREKLMHKNWQPQVVTMSGITDPYQPLERKLKITRSCLAVLAEFRNPVAIITKNHLVTRDLDLYAELSNHKAAAIHISITSLDPHMARVMEPRTSQPKMRLKAVEAFANAGVPVGIMIGPVLPGLTDHEIPNILEAAANAGARTAGYTMLRLPYAVKDLFQSWLDTNFPEKKDRVLSLVRGVRDGKLNDPDFGTRMTGTGPYADQIAQMFRMYKKRFGLDRKRTTLSIDAFRRPAADGQGTLF